MQTQLQAAINQICAEKNLDKNVVVKALEQGLSIAYRKDFSSPRSRIEVSIGDTVDDIQIFEIRTVVKKVQDFDLEISEKDAKKIRPDIKIDDDVYVPVQKNENFGRIAAQATKQVFLQQIQEAEKNMLFSKFESHVRELFTAKVQKVDRDIVLVDIDGVAAFLRKKDQIPNEKYFTGQRLKVYIESVEQTNRGPQLRITRSKDEFIEALFEQEIPEMRDGSVFIKKIARDPGVRTKMAVCSKERGVDPVGTFVGQRGSRINVVMEEVGEERIDIIHYHEDLKQFLLVALSPAKVSKVDFLEENGFKKAEVYVRPEERAIAIGKRGQNVRLTSKLMEMPVDILTFEGTDDEDEALKKETIKKEKKQKKEISDQVTIDILPDTDKEVIAALTEMGLSQIKQFEGLKPEELAEVGISLDQAKSLLKSVEKYLRGE